MGGDSEATNVLQKDKCQASSEHQKASQVTVVGSIAQSTSKCVGGRKDKGTSEGKASFLEGFGAQAGDQRSQVEAQGGGTDIVEHLLSRGICCHFPLFSTLSHYSPDGLKK